MKTTLEIPNSVFRRAKSAAAACGIPLRAFVTEAVKDKIDSRNEGWRETLVETYGQVEAFT